MRRIILIAIAASMLVATAAYSHHSYGANYDTSKEIKLQGKLVQFVFRNPHAFVQMQAPDQNGVTQRWAIEWSGTTQLGAPALRMNLYAPATRSLLSRVRRELPANTAH